MPYFISVNVDDPVIVALLLSVQSMARSTLYLWNIGDKLHDALHKGTCGMYPGTRVLGD